MEILNIWGVIIIICVIVWLVLLFKTMPPKQNNIDVDTKETKKVEEQLIAEDIPLLDTKPVKEKKPRKPRKKKS